MEDVSTHDSAHDAAAAPKSVLAPTQIETEHVHKVYDSIAPHFSHTRHHPWPLVTAFLHALPNGALVADVGCGNGKYLRVNPALCVIGSDRSVPLLTCSAQHSDQTFNLFGCDALKVPLRSGVFDAAISIAVLHHISTVERRVALISELARLVKIGGEIFIVAWAFEQDETSKRQFDEQDVMVEWKLQEKYVHDERQAEHAKQDKAKRWVVYQRYCHVYRRGELEALVTRVPGLVVVETQYSRSNWCLRVKRVDEDAATVEELKQSCSTEQAGEADGVADAVDLVVADPAVEAAADEMDRDRVSSAGASDEAGNADTGADTPVPRPETGKSRGSEGTAAGSDDGEQEEERHDDDDDDEDDGAGAGGSAHSQRKSAFDVQNDEEDEDADADEDSDTETSRIGDSALRFARRCVKNGEYSRALAALRSVVEMSAMESESCRRALLFCAQMLSATQQFDRSLQCMMELYQHMPPPYTTQDGQLIIARLYECQEQPRFVQFWIKKALGLASPSPSQCFAAWQALAHKAFEQQDFILACDAYGLALVRYNDVMAQDTTASSPTDEACSISFRHVARHLTAALEVAELQHDRAQRRQQLAFDLAEAMLDCCAEEPFLSRIHDADYLTVRAVYSRAFPSLYAFLFAEEDTFARRIASAWRVWRARVRRKQQVEAQRLAAAERAAAEKQARASKRKGKRTATRTSPQPQQRDPHAAVALRCNTKARVQSLRSSLPRQPSAVPADAFATHPCVSPIRVMHAHVENSPTRRKLNAVRRSRKKPQLDELPVGARPGSSRSESGSNAVDVVALASPIVCAPSTSLLDVYAFPTLADDKLEFATRVGRAPGAAELDLDQVEAFARMAHYRSRVLVQQHADVASLDETRVAPAWLRQYDQVLHWIGEHERNARATTLGLSTAPSSYFSAIHARVLFQLTKIHKQYAARHGRTCFVITLGGLLKTLVDWRFESVDQLLDMLRQARTLGAHEEAHRNLEFFHVHAHGPGDCHVRGRADPLAAAAKHT